MITNTWATVRSFGHWARGRTRVSWQDEGGATVGLNELLMRLHRANAQAHTARVPRGARSFGQLLLQRGEGTSMNQMRVINLAILVHGRSLSGHVAAKAMTSHESTKRVQWCQVGMCRLNCRLKVWLRHVSTLKVTVLVHELTKHVYSGG